MKRITIVLTLLLFTCALGFAEVVFTMSGSSTLEWGYEGTITDNSANFAGEIPTGNLFTDDSGKHEIVPNSITLSMEAADEDGMVIVKAQSKIDLKDWALVTNVDNKMDAFEYIDFPNVIPGTLGIWLGKSDDVETSVTATGSSTKSPELIATITPIDGLTGKLGFVMKQNKLNYNIGAISWAYDTYTNVAFSIFGQYKLAIGEADSVTAAVGTVFDTAWGKALVADTEGLAAADVTAGLTQQKYLAQTIAPANEAYTEITDTYGYATMPIGLAVDAVFGDLTGGVDFQTRLVQGSDTANLKNDDTGEFKAYEMPMYIGVDVGYELAAGDMTITPNANFKWNNDFWKWGLNDDFDGWEYKGLVSSADYLGRPMSANVGVDVEGIAGMIDVSLGVGLGLGDGAYNHGMFMLTDADGNYAPTLATILADTLDQTWVDDVNDKILISSTGATELSVGVKVALPMVAGLTISNDFSYTSDGMGFVGADDAALFGSFLTEIVNDFGVAYDLMVGDAVAATFFGTLSYEQIVPQTEYGTIYTLDPYTMEFTEQAAKSKLGYEIGVKAKVSF